MPETRTSFDFVIDVAHTYLGAARRYASIELRWSHWHIIVRLMRVYVESREIVASLERQYETARATASEYRFTQRQTHSLLLFVRSRACFSIPCSIVASDSASNAQVRSRPRGERSSRRTCTPSVRERGRRRGAAATAAAATTVPRAIGALARHRSPDRASRTRRGSMARRSNGGRREGRAAAWAIEIRLDHGTRREATVLRGC